MYEIFGFSQTEYRFVSALKVNNLKKSLRFDIIRASAIIQHWLDLIICCVRV